MMDSAKSYHRFTSYDRYGMTPHYLDWENQPAQFKHYPAITPVALPEVSNILRIPLLDACRKDTEKKCEEMPGAAQLARIFTLACGLTAKARQPGGDFYFRSAPSAGALYPNEIYLVWPGTSELAAGVYHFGFKSRRLKPLREGNPFSVLKQAFAREGFAGGPLFIVSGIFFRSAWKYRSRAYRYVLMDAGHLIENLRLALSAEEFSANVEYAFDDNLMDQLLGFDTEREVSLGCVQIPLAGTAPAQFPAAGMEPLPSAVSEASRVSEKEVRYEAILDIHNAGRKLKEPSGQWPAPSSAVGLKAESWMPLQAIAPYDAAASAPMADYAEAVFRRRSRRNFVRQPVTEAQFAYLLEVLCAASAEENQIRADDKAPVACGCLVGAVSGVDPGFYLLDCQNRQVGRVFEGHKLREMTAVCLDQAWLANAAVHFVLMTNLEMLDQYFGARGYRYAMMTAGRLGHLIYLGATALGLGCCGIGAFYDNEARNLLGLHPDADMLYLLGVGPLKSVR